MVPGSKQGSKEGQFRAEREEKKKKTCGGLLVFRYRKREVNRYFENNLRSVMFSNVIVFNGTKLGNYITNSRLKNRVIIIKRRVMQTGSLIQNSQWRHSRRNRGKYISMDV